MPPPTNNPALREPQPNREWRSAAGLAIIIHSLFLGVLLAQAALLGITIGDRLIRNSGDSLVKSFLHESPFIALLGLVSALITSPIIYFSLRRKQLGKAIITTYTPLFLIAFIAGFAFPPFSLLATFIALVLWSIVVHSLLPDWRLWHCHSCGYDLKNLTTPNCPECGKQHHLTQAHIE